MLLRHAHILVIVNLCACVCVRACVRRARAFMRCLYTLSPHAHAPSRSPSAPNPLPVLP